MEREPKDPELAEMKRVLRWDPVLLGFMVVIALTWLLCAWLFLRTATHVPTLIPGQL